MASIAHPPQGNPGMLLHKTSIARNMIHALHERCQSRTDVFFQLLRTELKGLDNAVEDDDVCIGGPSQGRGNCVYFRTQVAVGDAETQPSVVVQASVHCFSVFLPLLGCLDTDFVDER